MAINKHSSLAPFTLITLTCPNVVAAGQTCYNSKGGIVLCPHWQIGLIIVGATILIPLVLLALCLTCDFMWAAAKAKMQSMKACRTKKPASSLPFTTHDLSSDTTLLDEHPLSNHLKDDFLKSPYGYDSRFTYLPPPPPVYNSRPASPQPQLGGYM